MNKKNKIATGWMLFAIGLIFSISILFIGNVKGWFVTQVSDEILQVESTKGVASVQRNHVAIRLEKGMTLSEKDIVTTQVGSEISFSYLDSSIVTMQKTSFSLEMQEGILTLLLEDGTIFVDMQKQDSLQLVVHGETLNLTQATAFIQIQDGSTNLSVLKGEVEYKKEKIVSGKSTVLTSETKELSDVQVQNFNNDTLLLMANYGDLYIDANTIEKEIKNRDKVVESIINDEEIEITTTNPDIKVSEQQETRQEQATPIVAATEKQYVYIEINAYSILNNMDQLQVGKDVFVPNDGVILPMTKIEIQDGDSVMDILKRLCDATGIQLEYSYLPIYESHYIEGLNHLYEFDCGQGSGWVYKVNNWKPNYGVSQYIVKEDDVISFNYTCDYGNDLQ